MSELLNETITHVHHWTDTLFSFRTTRNPGFRFKSGQFTLIGLPDGDRPLMRAYSMVSAHYEEYLEFYSIKVPNGPLTSRLQHVKPGDTLLVNSKTTGTLINDELLPGKRLWFLSTGTGLAPFLSLIKDPEIYENYDQIILTHGVRHVRELAYAELIEKELPENEYFGDIIREKLLYYPTVTREPFRNQGRLTDLLASGQLSQDLGLPEINPEEDRFMLCGSPAMLKDMRKLLLEKGFQSSKHDVLGHFVIERAFVER